MIRYIRVCVDDDVKAARLTLATQILAYALMARPSGSRGYARIFERMGFAPQLQAQRASGASDDDLARAVPDEMLSAFGYAGPASGAAAAFEKLSEGLDLSIVRVLVARQGDDECARDDARRDRITRSCAAGVTPAGQPKDGACHTPLPG